MSQTVNFVTPRYVESPEECFFYHTMELPGFGVVPGHWDLRGRFDDYVGGVEVSGRSVLDVGTATGFLSFEAERRGASRVVSHDMSDVRQQTLLPFKDNIYYRDFEGWVAEYEPWIEKWKNGYWLCHRLLGSRAEVAYASVYDMPVGLGQFDVVIVGAVLEHLSDQVSALGSIARLARETMVVVTPLVETEDPIARFVPRADNPDNNYTWWAYSVGIYREVFRMLGFRIDRVMSAEYNHAYDGNYEQRFTIVATRE